MEIKAQLNYARLSTRRTRQVAKLIFGKNINLAKSILATTPKKPALEIMKLLKSAIKNAQNQNINIDNLFIKEIIVNEGPKLKRFFPGSRGRAELIKKKTTHIKMILSN
jgi:large subunit ribosomal protein L22